MKINCGQERKWKNPHSQGELEKEPQINIEVALKLLFAA